MFKKVVTILFCTALLLSGCQKQPPDRTEWSELWGNSGGNILEGGYVATNGETICYTDLNGRYDSLYKLNEDGEPTQLSNKLAYNLNIVNDRVYFVSGLPGPICSIRTDGTDFTTHVRGECCNLFVSQTHMAYIAGGELVVADITGKNAAVVASDVRKFIPFNGALVFATVDGLYQINPDGTELQCLFDEPPISLCANSAYLYFSVSNDMESFGKAGGRVYQIDEDSAISQLPMESECWDMNATDDYIFFRNQTELGSLYRVDIEGNQAICLLEENCTNLNVVGESIILRVITTGKSIVAGYYIIEQDGNDLRLFDGNVWRQL